MKKLLLAILLFLTPFAFAATKENPAEFTVKVHVVSSASHFYVFEGSRLRYYQTLETVIDSQPVELTSDGYDFDGVLKPGDYPGALVAGIQATDPNTYDVYRQYDLRLPDGSARRYRVTRLGPAVGTR
jgi:hypothetical protein